jgi:hypothetical protein
MPHRIGELRDKPPEPFRAILTLYPAALADRLDQHLEDGGLPAHPDERDAVVIRAVTELLDRAEARRA